MEVKKKMKKLMLAAIIVIWAVSAMAHSPLKTTIPADKSSITVVPFEVIMDFRDKIRLTKVSITHDDNSSVDLDLTDFIGFNSDYVFPIHSMGSGNYVIKWRGLGADGHALNGFFSFTVR